MWGYYDSQYTQGEELSEYRPYLILDDKLWNEALRKMVKKGMNMVVITLGDGVKYESHPEIAVRGAWSASRLRKELQKIRKMGIEPIPELNFSAGHDAWLCSYSRMLSTDKYYEVCSDLIEEVIDIFDKPRFFYLGMDEETSSHQKGLNYSVVRRNDIWWETFIF